MNIKTLRQSDQRNLCRLQTEGATALLTVEMGMQVVYRVVILPAMAIGTAHGILEHARSVVNGMNQVMGEEQRDGAVDGRFVHRVQLILQTLEREGIVVRHHRAQQQEAQCRGLDIVLLQQGNIFTLVLHR